MSKTSVKQHLAALFAEEGKTRVLDREEARALIESIDTGTLTGLRDRALIATMVYTFARVGAVLQQNVRDYFTQGRRGWMRLHEKGGKELEAPCHHKLEIYMDEYIAAWGIAEDKDGPLWRTTGRATGIPRRMVQKDAYKVIERRAKQAGIKTKIGNHSLRATGITDYLKSDGSSLTKAREMANHSDTRTTQLYDRRADVASIGEYEKMGFRWPTLIPGALLPSSTTSISPATITSLPPPAVSALYRC